MKLSPESVTTNPSTTTPPTARPGSPKSDWRLYAAAGAATLAATSAVDASIIYTPINQTVNLKRVFNTVNDSDFRNSANAPFGIGVAIAKQFSAEGVGQGHGNIRSHVFLEGQSVAATKQGGLPEIFGSNQPITFNHGLQNNGPGTLRYGIGHAFHTQEDPASRRINRFAPANQPFFVGFKTVGKSVTVGFNKTRTVTFTYSGNKYTNVYGNKIRQFEQIEGWLRLELDTDSSGYIKDVQLIDEAYTDVAPGITFSSGQGTPVVPEPSALGLLAIGSAGVLAWRRRRTGVASKE